jgi:hypothetical protein
MRLGISVDYGMSRPTAKRSAKSFPKLLGRLAELQKQGLDHVRFELPMRETEDIATRADHPAVQAIAAFRKLGLDVVPVVGVGSRKALPASLHVDDPDYVARVSKNVHDIAARLAPLGVRDYQIENELNVAGIATLPVMHWREGHRWWDLGFKRELIGALAYAVKTAAPNARVNHNFFDGMTDPTTTAFGRDPSWSTKLRGVGRVAAALMRPAPHLERALRELSPSLDEVGLDSYPDYVVPHTVARLFGSADPERFAKRVAAVGALTGKPIRIAETGYESRSPFGHGPAGQAAYVAETSAAAQRSGAVAYTYFRLADYPRIAPRATLDPNRLVEPYFGLLDGRLEPKVGARLRLGTRWVGPLRVPWLVRDVVSSWDAFKRALADAHAQ